jgi:hypothetical protein
MNVAVSTVEPMSASEAKPPPSGRGSRSRWRRRLVLALLLLGCLYLLRAPILRGLAGLLIVDERVTSADYIVLPDEDRFYADSAHLYHAGLAPQILLIWNHTRRLERLGIIDSFEVRAWRALKARGVPQQAVVVTHQKGFTDWDSARNLGGWLAQHPHATVTLVCDRLGSRRLRLILDQVLEPTASQRVSVRALAAREYDESNWWQRKEGLLGFFNSVVCLGYVYCCGEGTGSWHEWDADGYEKRWCP